MANAPRAWPQARRSPVPEQFQRRITARSLIVGAVSIALISVVNPYLQFMLKSWWIAGVGSLLSGPILTLFLLLAVNSLLT